MQRWQLGSAETATRQSESFRADQTLGVGEAVLVLPEQSRLMRMTQSYRDAGTLGLPPLALA